MINLANMDCCDCGSLFFVIMDFQKKNQRQFVSTNFLQARIDCNDITLGGDGFKKGQNHKKDIL